jgi:TP901 family phage tail tape measure protein
MAITVAALQAKMGYDDDELSRGLNSSQSKISSFGGIAKAGLLAVGSSIAAGLAAVGASVVTMEDALTPLMTMTGKNTDQFRAMESAVKDVIKSSPHSANDIGMAAYEILGAGITDAAEAHSTLLAANKLSLAGLGPIGDSVNLITSAMNAWRSENIKGEDAAKILFGTISVGKGTIADFSRGFGAIAPLASNVGVSFKELMAATATLTTAGLPASEAYTGLRAAFSNILKPTKEASGVAESLGIEMSAAGLKAKGLAGFIADVAEKSGGSTDTLVSLFGSMEAVNAIMGLTGPNAEAFAQAFQKIDDAGQNLDQTSKDVTETFSNRIKIMKNNVLIYLSEIGNQGLDWLSDKWKEWGPSIMKAVRDFTSELDGIGTPDGGFFKRLGDSAGNARDTLATVFENIGGGLSRFMDGWNSPGRGPSDFWAELGGMAKDADTTLKEVWTNIGIGFDELTAVINGDGGRVKKEGWLGGVDAIGLFIRDTLPGIKEAWEEFKTVMAGIIPILEAIGKVTVEYLIPILAKLSEKNITLIDVLRPLGKVITEEVWPALKLIGGIINDYVFPALDRIGRVTVAIVVPAIRFLADELDSIGRFVVGVVIPIFKWLGDQLDQIGRITIAILVGAFKWLARELDSIGRATVGVFKWVVDQLDQIGRGVFAIIGLIGKALGLLKPIINISLWDIGSWLYNAGRSLIIGLINGMNSLWNLAADTARNLVSNVVNSAWKALKPGSPSREGRDMGRNFTEGLIAGMNDNKQILASTAANMANAMVSATQYNYNIGGPGNVQVNMPTGANGNDVVRALRDWQKANGRIPVAVTGRNA